MKKGATERALPYPPPTPVSEYRKILETGRKRRREAFLQIQQMKDEEEERFRQNLELLGHEHGLHFSCPGVVRRRWES